MPPSGRGCLGKSYPKLFKSLLLTLFSERTPEGKNHYLGYVHRLSDTVHNRGYQNFHDTLPESKKYTSPQKVRTALNTLTSYALEIENSLTYMLSNGVVEGTVNKIKLIKRSGYRYQNYSHLRCHILISTKFQHRHAPPVRHLYFSDEYADQTYNTQRTA